MSSLKDIFLGLSESGVIYIPNADKGVIKVKDKSVSIVDDYGNKGNIINIQTSWDKTQ